MSSRAWRVSNISKAKYLGVLEFQADDGEYHYFEILETPTRLVFGGATNSGFLESGYMVKDKYARKDENLQELLSDLEVFYNAGKRYTSRIVVNDRM
jgi:hypothetical protein